MKMRIAALMLIVLILFTGCKDTAAPLVSPNARFHHSAMGSDAHAVAQLNAEITHYRSPAVRFLDDVFGIER